MTHTRHAKTTRLKVFIISVRHGWVFQAPSSEEAVTTQQVEAKRHTSTLGAYSFNHFHAGMARPGLE